MGPVYGCDVWRVLYWNADANNGQGAYELVPGVWAFGSITEDQTGQPVGGINETADDSAEIVVCTGPNLGYSAELRLTNQAFGTVSNPNLVGQISGGDTENDDIVIDYFVSSSSASRVFVNLSATTSASQAFLGYSRADIGVTITSTGTSSYYDPNQDQINLLTSGIWGEWGIFTLAHEYGHAVQEKALGGIAALGQCPASGHSIDGAYTLGCAYTEGFADFHGVYARRDVLTHAFVSDYLIEQDTYYPGYTYDASGNRTGTSTDGSIIEGAVAAFFYDLVDGPSDPDSYTNQSDGDDDAVQYPGQYLADIVRTCSVTFGIRSRRANGVDDLAYCFERTVDPAVRNSTTYFPTRSSDSKATLETEGATEPANWSQAAIRTLWTHNLYGQ
jgi:hypothetical protein